MRSLVIRSCILPGLLLPVLALAVTPISLTTGWNLVGNSDATPIDVATRLGDQTKITTVWKWNKLASKWAFYAPSMTSSNLSTYAESKGYDVLTRIDSKEGFWINAAAAVVLTDSLATPPAVGAPAVTLTEGDLAQGWNLMGSADNKTPSQLNGGLSSSLNAAGKAISTVWAWEAPSARWKFYAPTLEAQGGTVLSAYITSKGYLSFTSILAATDGFWLNIGAVTPVTVTPPAAVASLHALSFTRASDWYLRVTTSTVAQDTPAADGTYRYRELRTARAGGGTPYNWGAGSSPQRGADLHWNGSSWLNCPINFENTQSVRDANGNSIYNYCSNLETGASHRAAPADISGRPMIDVYNEVTAAGNTNLTISAASTVLGTSSFPTGSVLYYQTGTPSTEAITYYPGTNNYVYQTNSDVAAGKTSITDTTAACASITGGTAQTMYASVTATLDGLIAVNKGTPCVYGVSTVTGSGGVTLTSGSRNEWWSNSLLSLGTIGNAPTYSNASSATSYYTTNIWLGVGFGSGNVANYYSCQQRYNSGGGRNCNLIGSGTYAIQTLGDAKTLSFSGLPTQASALDYTRVFVERGGYVHLGYQSKPIVSDSARLNLIGLNALFSTLGLPVVDPNTPIALTAPSYAGTYSGTFSGTDSGTFVTSISTSGVTFCAGTSVLSGAISCTFTVLPSAADTTIANISLGITGGGAMFTGTVNFYTGILSGSWANGTNSGTFFGNRF